MKLVIVLEVLVGIVGLIAFAVIVGVLAEFVIGTITLMTGNW